MKNDHNSRRRSQKRSTRPSGRSLRRSIQQAEKRRRRNSQRLQAEEPEEPYPQQTEQHSQPAQAEEEEEEDRLELSQSQEEPRESLREQEELDHIQEETEPRFETKQHSKPRKKRRSTRKRMGSAKKQAASELRQSWARNLDRSPKAMSLFGREGGFDLHSSKKESEMYIAGLEEKLKELEQSGEYLKADAVFQEIKQTKARYSQQVVENIRRELGEGERVLQDSLYQEEEELQKKFDELRVRIMEDFEAQTAQIKEDSENLEAELVANFTQGGGDDFEKNFKKSPVLLRMEHQLQALVKERNYIAAEKLKEQIARKFDDEILKFRTREEVRLEAALKKEKSRCRTELEAVELRLHSALSELQIAFREQREALQKRQATLKKNFKNREMQKLNRATFGSSNKETYAKFRNHYLRKQPFQGNRFRKTALNKENFGVKLD